MLRIMSGGRRFHRISITLAVGAMALFNGNLAAWANGGATVPTSVRSFDHLKPILGSAASLAAPDPATPSAARCTTRTLSSQSNADFTNVVRGDGTVWSWGQNGFGQLGDGTTMQRNTPVEVVGVGGNGALSNIASVTPGQANGAAVSADGTVYTWGGFGLGNGTTGTSTTPVQVVGPSGTGYLAQILQVAAGITPVLALRGDGTVWSWGQNFDGELGLGTMDSTTHTMPAEVVGPGGAGFLTGIVSVATGQDHSLALRSDGTVWAWGNNKWGDLGNGDANTASSAVPVEVLGPGGTGNLSGIVAIAGGDNYSMALKADGTVWAWGKNTEGELGIGTSDGNNHLSPTEVLGPGGVGFLGGVTAIAGGTFHSSAVRSDGTAWTWGADNWGELGNGDSVQQLEQNAPVQVVGPGGAGFLSGVTAISGGYGYGTALKSDGTVWAWGWNFYGTLGQGTSDTNAHASPVQVLGPGAVGNLTGVGQAGPCNSPTQPETAGGVPIDERPTTVSFGSYPVNAETGNFWHTFTDIAIPGRGIPLRFTRTYNSQNAGQNGPLGYGWTDNYNVFLTPESGKTLSDPKSKITVHDENGATLIFTPVGNGNYKPPARVLGSLQASGGLFQLSRRDQTSLFFNSLGQLTKEIDRNNYAISLSYSNNLLATVTDASGRTLSFSYYSSPPVIASVSDVANRSVTFKYDGSVNLQIATDLGGFSWQFGYDANHQLRTMTDPRNGTLTNWYDTSPSGRVYQQQDPMSRFTNYDYSVPGQTTITDPKGNVTRQFFVDNEVNQITFGVGTPQEETWRYSYDGATLGLLSSKDPAGNFWVNTWDSAGNLLTHADPLGNTWTYTYDSLNDVRTAQDPNKVTTTNTYDGYGNLVTSSTPIDNQTATTVYTYSDTAHPGEVTSMTDPNGKLWQYGYDLYGVRNKVTDPLNNIGTSSRDKVGRLLSTVSPNGHVTLGNPAAFTTTYTPDAFGRPTLVTDPLGHQTIFHYDPNGNMDSLTDANHHLTSYTYDADNELFDVQRADTTHLTTGYDKNGNVASQTDGMGYATTYSYDPLNRLQSITDPLNRTTSATYDDVNETAIVTDPQGRTTTYQFDIARRLHGIVYSDGTTANVAFTYYADGERESMTDGTGTTKYTIDALHRLTQVVTGSSQAVKFAYDLKGQLTSITYPGGTNTVTRVYDDAGRLSKVIDWLKNTTSYGYDSDSNLTSVSYPNKASGTVTYDNADRLTSMSGASGKNMFSLAYNPDPIGQATTENTLTYGYNAINQLTGVGSSTYSYDSADNLHQVAISGSTTTTLVDDPANQLSTFTQMNGTTQVQKLTFGYDPEGNRTTKTDQNSVVTTYAYDQANRLIKYNSTSPTYAYNGDGLRMSKTLSGATTQQTWDVAEGHPILIQDGTTSYITGVGGLPLEAITSSGTPIYYHQDRLGSTRALTDSKGGVLATYSYDAYGTVTPSAGAPANPFLFAGQYTDSESGLQYDRARYYDSTVGGFISRDPMSAATRQPYAYAADTPVNVTDPSGLGFAEAGQALVGGLNDLGAFIGIKTLLDPVDTAKTGAFYAADWADTEHDWLVSGDPLKVTVAVADVFSIVFTLGAAAGPSAAAVDAAESGSGLVRVGRWMSPQEFEAMQETNAVQLSRSGVTHVSLPSDPETFVARAKPGTGYVEFDVPAERLQALGDGNARIIGPGAGDIYNILRVQRGLEPFTEPSPAFNISDWLAIRW